MKYYAGLDVSLKETFVSIIDESGKVIKEDVVLSDGKALSLYLESTGYHFSKIGIESGQLSIALCKSLSKRGLPVICVDARHMAAALSARVNKNDRNDARGIAQMLRAGLYKEVQIKSDSGCEEKALLGSRRQLVSSRQQLMGTIRGLLKIYGIKIGSQTQFISKVRKSIKDLPETVNASMEPVLLGLESLESSIDILDCRLIEFGKKDEDCKLLMTVPGVGIITAMTYKATLDNPKRFDQSETVGAYLGLTPRSMLLVKSTAMEAFQKWGLKNVEQCFTKLLRHF